MEVRPERFSRSSTWLMPPLLPGRRPGGTAARPWMARVRNHVGPGILERRERGRRPFESGVRLSTTAAESSAALANWFPGSWLPPPGRIEQRPDEKWGGPILESWSRFHAKVSFMPSDKILLPEHGNVTWEPSGIVRRGGSEHAIRSSKPVCTQKHLLNMRWFV